MNLFNPEGVPLNDEHQTFEQLNNRSSLFNPVGVE